MSKAKYSLTRGVAEDSAIQSAWKIWLEAEHSVEDLRRRYGNYQGKGFPFAGFNLLREIHAANYHVPVENVRQDNGAMTLVSKVLDALRDRSERRILLMDSRTYDRAHKVAIVKGFTPIGVQMDDNGQDPEHVQELLHQHRGFVAGNYIIAGQHNPIAMVQTPARVHAIGEMMADAGASTVVDNSYNRAGNGIAGAFKTGFFDMQDELLRNAIVIETTTKSLLPGEKVSTAVSNDSDLMARLHATGDDEQLNAHQTPQLITYKLLESGQYDAHIVDCNGRIYNPRTKSANKGLRDHFGDSSRFSYNDIPDGGWFGELSFKQLTSMEIGNEFIEYARTFEDGVLLQSSANCVVSEEFGVTPRRDPITGNFVTTMVRDPSGLLVHPKTYSQHADAYIAENGFTIRLAPNATAEPDDPRAALALTRRALDSFIKTGGLDGAYAPKGPDAPRA